MSRIIQGNCVEVMKQFPTGGIDMVLTDPPYLVNYVDRTGRSIANDKNDDWLEPAFKEVHRVLKKDAICVSFYGWTKVDLFFKAWKGAGFRVAGHIVFTKAYASTARFVKYHHESAFVLVKGQPELPANPLPDVMPFEYSGNQFHPTQKPLSALQPLIESFTNPGDIVLDPFAGSGSTCIAAMLAKRRYLGIELDSKYHAAALKRMDLMTRQGVAA